MDLLHLDNPIDDLDDPVIVMALDGWTDAGRGGSLASDALLAQWDARQVGAFDTDRLYDYRDRRPSLTIDRGLLSDPVWPGLSVHQLTPGGAAILLIKGAEPDLSWRTLCADLAELAKLTGAQRYVGLGSVPAPVPHTRPVAITTTASREELVTRLGMPHQRLIVPASCQVVVERALGDAGLTALGMWARIPHYVAGDYPAAAVALARSLSEYLSVELDLADLITAAGEHREQLDIAAEGSDEIIEHIRQLEQAYDENIGDQLSFGDLPTGDELAAEFERFLRRQSAE